MRSGLSASLAFPGLRRAAAGRNGKDRDAGREREDRAYGGFKKLPKTRHRNEATEAGSCHGEEAGRVQYLSARASRCDRFLRRLRLSLRRADFYGSQNSASKDDPAISSSCLKVTNHALSSPACRRSMDCAHPTRLNIFAPVR